MKYKYYYNYVSQLLLSCFLILAVQEFFKKLKNRNLNYSFYKFGVKGTVSVISSDHRPSMQRWRCTWFSKETLKPYYYQRCRFSDWKKCLFLCVSPMLRKSKTYSNEKFKETKTLISYTIDNIKISSVYRCKSGILSLHGGSLDITLTVPLITWLKL